MQQTKCAFAVGSMLSVFLTLTASAQTQVSPTFTYQGYLTDAGASANGVYDLRFILFDAQAGGNMVALPFCLDGVPITDGLFTATLNVGLAFADQERFIEISVRENATADDCGIGSYSTLTPRQRIAPTPYALALPGLRTNPAPRIANIIGGSAVNTIPSSVVGALIAGGGEATVGGIANAAHDDFTAVLGGAGNAAGANDGDFSAAAYATVAGGLSNTASGLASFVAGGSLNQAGGAHSFAAGRRAKVRGPAASGDADGDEGTFVWADTTNSDFTSTGPGQFLIRTAGGVGINAPAPEGELHVRGLTGDTLGKIVLTPGTSDAVAEFHICENTTASRGVILRYEGTTTNQLQIVGLNGDIESGTIAAFDRDTNATTLNGNLDVGGVVNIGALAAAAGQERLRIVRGRVSSTGAILEGAGFTATRSGTGLYTLQINGFAAPTVVATCYSNTPRVATQLIDAPSVFIRTFDLAGTPTDCTFSFIAMEP